jgi:actin-like ATPase involved in cell morphogenesis
MTLGVTGGAEGYAEAVGLDVAQRTPRSEFVPGGLVGNALEPIVAAIAGSVHEMLSEIPAGLAEDVVRGKVRLAGGGALLPGLASRIETAAGIGTVLVEDPLRCVIRGAAEILERKDAKGQPSGVPGLRSLFAAFLTPGAAGRWPAAPGRPSAIRRPPRRSACRRR